MREDVERFFCSYRDAYNSGDPAAIARHIAVPCLMLERAATVWSTEAEVVAAMDGLIALYRRSGFKAADFTVRALMEQGPDDVAADIAWTIERHEQPSWRFHTGYNLRQIGGIWRIVFCTAYQEPAARQPS